MSPEQIIDIAEAKLRLKFPGIRLYREQHAFTAGEHPHLTELHFGYSEDLEFFYVSEFHVPEASRGKGHGLNAIEAVFSALKAGEIRELYLVDNINPEFWIHVANKFSIEIHNFDV